MLSIRSLFLLAIVLSVFSAVLAKNCDNTKGANTFNPDCDSKKQPYCVLTVTGTSPTFECRECISSCDCDNDEFCSNKPGQKGECKKFGKNGKKCRPLSTGQLTQIDYPEEWKCAELYSENNVLVIDQEGVCIEQTCRYCDYRGGGGGLTSCGVDTGLKGERRCAYPGTLVDNHKYPWVKDVYYENPEAVWWAIFFTFFMILLGVQIASCVFTFFQWRSGN